MKNKKAFLIALVLILAAALTGIILALSGADRSEPAENTGTAAGGTDNPVTDAPGTDVPGTDVPGTDVPDTEIIPSGTEPETLPAIPKIVRETEPAESDTAGPTETAAPEVSTESGDSEKTEPAEAVTEPEPATEKTVSVIVPVIPEDPEPSVTGLAEEEPSLPAETAKEPVKNDPPVPAGTIVIGGTEPGATPYDCGTPHHHCDGPETHAFLSNLELRGCPYCGSHSCVSFYAVDAWGYACYDPCLCPEYGTASDPLDRCSACGKKTGDGSRGTCVTFNVDMICPLCGAEVGAWECHTCR